MSRRRRIRVSRIAPLIGANGLGVPFRAVHIVDGDEGRLAAHGQAHIALAQAPVDFVAGRGNRLPLLLRIGQRHARAFEDARHLHLVGERDLGFVVHAGDGRGALRRRRRGQRNVALAREQARGRIEPDPARARQINLGPGVQIGEVVLGARRPVERFHVGLELDQVARHEARREPVDGAGCCTSSQAESRQEPDRFLSVSSGVCTPGSMRIR